MSSPISGLPVADTPLNLADLITIVQGGVTKQATIGDIPDADIITNANGTAVRWESGLQIAFNRVSRDDISSSSDVIGIDGSYPANFFTPPFWSAQWESTNSSGAGMGTADGWVPAPRSNANSTTAWTIRFKALGAQAGTSTVFSFDWIAVGMWK